MSIHGRMRQTLTQLELLSHGGTMRWDRSRGAGDRHGPSGEGKPPHEHYARRYQRAGSDAGRVAVLRDAERELRTHRRRPEPPPPVGRDDVRTMAGKGLTQRDIASQTPFSQATVSRMLRDDG